MARTSVRGTQTPILVLFATLLALCISIANAVSLPNSNDWINSNYVKQIDLGGSTSHTLTTISIRPKSTPSNDVLPYYFLLSAHEAEHLSWSRLTIKPALDSPLASSSEYKGGVRPLIDFSPQGAIDGDADSYLYEALIPTSVLGADGATLTLETTLNHITTALPETVKQTDPQLYLWTGDAAIRSPYTTDSGRIKVKAASPRIVSFTPQDATKSGSIVTFGPSERIAPYTASSPVAKGSVHFQADVPRATIVTLDRTAEISHWGDALSITDRMLLRNAGPKLKGHFSRIEHQMASFYNRASGSALSTLTMTLPAGTKDPWFIDQIGNVSTSRFRASRPDPSLLTSTVGIPASQALISRLSLLELQPRFPLLGGWNYTFSVGYTLPLSTGGWTKRLAGSDDYLTAIPFFTPLKDVAVDELSTTIVLPEGATRVGIELPFPMDNVDNGIVKTYLDTMGRPAVQLTRRSCSSEHAQLVYVKYTLTHRANMAKVGAVALVTGALLVATAVLQRVETKIKG